MNTFGRIYKIAIFGESHGAAIGVLIDGCPPGIALSETDFIADMAKRKPVSTGSTLRKESDWVHIISGVFNGYTTGAPIMLQIQNENVKSKDYDNLKDIPRPGHADFTSQIKYSGFADKRGGGHFSGRLTAAIVAAGVIAKKIIPNVRFNTELLEAGGSGNINEAVRKALDLNDSIGGLIECRINGLPVGLGEPFFDSVESLLSHFIFSIPAIKGIEFGSGFAAAAMYGSEHNDPILDSSGKTSSNYAGGINGGITNGNEVVFRVAVKPASSISKIQKTINLATGETDELSIAGRHDACIALRAPVVVEAAAACVFADLYLLNNISEKTVTN